MTADVCGGKKQILHSVAARREDATQEKTGRHYVQNDTVEVWRLPIGEASATTRKKS